MIVFTFINVVGDLMGSSGISSAGYIDSIYQGITRRKRSGGFMETGLRCNNPPECARRIIRRCRI